MAKLNKIELEFSNNVKVYLLNKSENKIILVFAERNKKTIDCDNSVLPDELPKLLTKLASM